MDDTPKVIPISAFTSTSTAALCGAFAYTITDTTGTALSTSIFTPDTTTPKLTVSTATLTAAASYQIRVTGY